MPKKQANKKVILLDSHAIIHRAYHALPDFASSKGEPTGALYGLSMMLFSLIKEFKPDYIFAAYDLPKPTYRHEAYADYKSGRRQIDNDLAIQLQNSRDVFKAFNIPIYEKEGFEADDILGTIVEELKDKKDVETIIASGDMDTMQLVTGDKVKVFTLRKGIKDTVLYNQEAVLDRFGFLPKYLPDYKGLRGDTSDNIIGIPGIGEKTATTLISHFGSIENIYKKLNKIEKDKEIREEFTKIGIKERIINLLIENKEEAEFSKMLATIRRDAPISFDLPNKKWLETVSIKNIRQLFVDLEFRSLENRLAEMFSVSDPESKKVKVEKDEPTTEVDQKELRQSAVALWLLNSSMINPTLQDILHFTKKDSLKEAKEKLLDEIKKQGLDFVYEKMEKPLVDIILKMEENGILIDTKVLTELSKEYHQKLDVLEKEIWKMSGEEFNINSPKQMAEVLFTKMQLSYKGMRKTSSGSYSTKEEVLQKLADVHPIALKILDYRELQKLVSTYIDNIPKLLAKDSRLHAHFLQTGTTTGRMSSQDPNLQNIPIKSEYGRRIRNAFVAPKGYRLLALDYSQIELRIAAFLSGDPKLIEIFKEGKDVHTNVASFVFKVEPEKVDKEMRRKAKVINFGILYGMGVTALQKNLGTDRKEAQKFYDDYFDTFNVLAEYLDEVKKETAKKGYTETLFGRRRYFEGINSKLPFIKAQAERMAINAPIQGTQADVTKLAMVEIDKYLDKNNLSDKAKLLLQIHDEVIYEVEEDLVEELSLKLKEIMATVISAVSKEAGFKEDKTKGVPIIAESSSGQSWGTLKRI